MNHQYPSNLANCSMDESLQTLMDKLSSKSSQLYIFWQNYNQLYNLYQQKTTEVTRLREEVTVLRRQLQQPPKVQIVEKEDTFLKERYLNLEKNFEEIKVQDTFLKERYINLEKNLQQIKLQNERLKNETRQLRKQTSIFHDQNVELYALLQKLQQENNTQRTSIERILNQLKSAQNELTGYSKLYQQMQQKDLQLNRMVENEKALNEIIAEREEEIDELVEAERVMKVRYEELIKESMDSVRNRVRESFPELIQTSKQKVQVITM